MVVFDMAFLDTGLLTIAIGDTKTNDAGGYQSLHRFRNKEVSRIKLAVVITMILAIIAPVMAQTSKLKLYECYFCGQQKFNSSSPSSYEGQCFDKHTGKKRSSHNWGLKQ